MNRDLARWHRHRLFQSPWQTQSKYLNYNSRPDFQKYADLRTFVSYNEVYSSLMALNTEMLGVLLPQSGLMPSLAMRPGGSEFTSPLPPGGRVILSQAITTASNRGLMANVWEAVSSLFGGLLSKFGL
jgi:hypothetical protein